MSASCAAGVNCTATVLPLQACLAELRAQLKRLDVVCAVSVATSSQARSATADDVPDAEELRTALTSGLQHCLYWLLGLELPGLGKQEEWGNGFQVRLRSVLRANSLAAAERAASSASHGQLHSLAWAAHA